MKLDVALLPMLLAVAFSFSLISCGESGPSAQDNTPDSTESRTDELQRSNDPSSAKAEITFHVDGLMKTESGAT